VNRPNRASVSFILITLLLSTLGVGVVVPVLPRIVSSFLGGDIAASSRYYGSFVAVYAAMQFLFAPILGGLSDRFGRRPVILMSLLGAALDYLLLALAPDLAWLFVGRVMAGITGASFSAASAYIADVTPPEKRAQSFGLIGAAFGLGFIIGPAAGGVLGSIHLRLPFLAAAGLSLANFLYGLFVLPESLAPENRRPFSFRRANPLSSLRNLGRHRVILGLTGALVCSFMAQHILRNVWALYTEVRFGWDALDIGLSMALVGLAGAIVQGVLIRPLFSRLGERRALVLGLAVSVTGFVAIGVASQGWLLCVFIVPFALGGIAEPAMQGLISREVGPSEQGQLQGSLASLASLTAIAGPLLGTGLFAWFARPLAGPSVPGAPFFAAACFQALALVLVLRLFARIPPKAP